MFEVLKLFYNQHGHTQVPSTFHDQNSATWVKRQRRSQELSEEQKKQLTDLGFQFGYGSAARSDL